MHHLQEAASQRNYNHSPDTHTRSTIDRILFSTACAMPPLLVFLLVHAIYFPGQMSPDSIDQYIQAITGNLSDAHPVASTLLIRLFTSISPSPEVIIFLNYSFFIISLSILIFQLDSISLIPRFILIITSIVFSFFPPNFFIATTLWKDVPYASGIILITAGIIKLHGKDGDAGYPSKIIFLLGCAITIGMRHNGILLVAPLVAFFFLISKRSLKKFYLGSAFLLACLFILAKTVLLSATGAKPVDQAYRSIFSLPILGVMLIEHGGSFSDSEKEILSEVLPLDDWREAYSCSSVVPLFWHPNLSRDALRNQVEALNLLALRKISAHPITAFKHQACMTSIVWNPFPSADQWIAISPHEITQFSHSIDLALKTDSKLPEVREWLDTKVAAAWERSAPFNRPATYMWVGTILCLAAALRGQSLWLVLSVPAIMNAVSLTPTILSQDYRYMWPTALLFLFLGPAALWSLLTKQRK